MARPDYSHKHPTFHTALNAAILSSGIPFCIYDQSFFPGEGELEGDYYVMSENMKSEYAIVIKAVKVSRPTPTLAGIRDVTTTEFHVFHPYYDEGDASVGMDDAWIIDFDETKPDFVSTNIGETCVHAVNYFMNAKMLMSIDNTLESLYWQKEKEERDNA